LLTGAAVVFAVFLSTCMRGLQDGSYDQMIDQAVRQRLAHLQVHPEGYLTRPGPELQIQGSDELRGRLLAFENVRGVSPRVMTEGVAARDTHNWSVEIMGVDPEAEADVSIVSERVLEGERAEEWCRENLARALRLFGNDQDLFDRWCGAAQRGRYLERSDERGMLIGSGVAKRLVVSVGDEVTVQAVRAVDSEETGGERRGAVSQRRLEVVGVVHTGNPDIDDALLYVQMETLMTMLGVSGPNELAIMLEDIDELESTRDEMASIVGPGLEVHTWAERNPTLKSLIDTDSQMGVVMLVILILLVALGVVNATLMSVLERTKEFGIMLALGVKRASVFGLVMTEVALLGIVSVAIGALIGAGFEIYGRIHGWPLEWFVEGDVSDISMAGGVIDPVYYSGLEPAYGAIIVVGTYLLFLASGFFPALRASRLKPVDAMRK